MSLIVVVFKLFDFCQFKLVLRVVERGCYSERDAATAVRELCEAVAVR